jgi:hypothetical protein
LLPTHLGIGGIRILTDPWFTQTATYYQGEPVASTVDTLGRIDAVAPGARVPAAP